MAERLVRAFLVVVARELYEAALLGGAVWLGRPHGLQKREMEAFVPAILLRMTRVDPFVLDAKLAQESVEELAALVEEPVS